MNWILFLAAIQTFVILGSDSARFKFHIGTIEGLSYAHFGLPRAGAAISMAVEKIRALYNDTIEFRHTIRHAKNGPAEAGAVAASMHFNDKVDGFIGPGSSLSVEAMVYMASQWNLPFFTPHGASVALAVPLPRPILTSLAELNIANVAMFLVNILNSYSWRHVVVLHDVEIHSKILWKVVKSELEMNSRFIWTDYQVDADKFKDGDYDNVLSQANMYARVFIVLHQLKGVRPLVLSAERLGFTTGTHAIIFATAWVQNKPESYWKQNDENDETAKQALRSCLLVTRIIAESKAFENFASEVKARSLVEYNYDYKTRALSSGAVTYYDAFMIFAQVVNETLAERGNPLDGTAFTQNVWNRTFPGIAGRNVINANGIRDSDLNLDSIDPYTETFNVVGEYKSDENAYYPTKLPIYWPNSQGPPPDIPACGFKNDRCYTSREMNTTLLSVLMSVFALLLFAICLAVFHLVRRWKKKSEAELWWWRVDSNNLKMIRGDMFEGNLLGSHVSKASFVSTTTSVQFMEAMTNIALYRGVCVQLRMLSLECVAINRQALLELKQIRDLNHNNLVRVHGACIEDPLKYLVTEYCSKGTLQDLLANSTIDLDLHFKFSLVTDIIEGMCFLHNSSIQKHGRLTSGVCLIDNRFSVKLTDYGLAFIYNHLHVDRTSQEFKTECLWKAPEVLRDPDMKGTQAADVYSFGIILQEVITREEPFIMESDTYDINAILSQIKSAMIPPFRPRVEFPENLLKLKSFVQSCWCEDPHLRPTFHIIKKTVKALASRYGTKGNLLDNLLKRMEQYANNLEKLVDEKTVELKEEKKKSEELLYQILPRSVAGKLRLGQRIDPEGFSCVTIYFSDICGFTKISARSTPLQVVALLNDLYTCFDATIDIFDVYKVETIGDAYMVVSGLPQRNGNRHAVEIARMSLALLKAIETFTIRHLPDEKLRLRIGLHSGPVVAGVVGLKMPRYCLFGDTVNTASRMESHGEELKIHMSDATHVLLYPFITFYMELRGTTDIKGKGEMKTYWLLGEDTESEKH